ncbi:Uncharacterised protein [Phocoenobacter uteri]|uniref:Antitoxin VbhA domain-containing protein n=1 Tax=Phocoenobacter uteri TaxID=146806 RepID=A0A379DEW1_9PAST|nr:antitoxin VbhA family protein [Phocoenobacter uteri]MDG6882836.1 hypothetical protein [Phocoenobacter uteri]SUB76419.1 Uncharacterised protein [Phocoenobacter uteri]
MNKNDDLKRRNYHVRNAIASFALEGEIPSPHLLELLKKYENGEISSLEELEIKFENRELINEQPIK